MEDRRQHIIAAGLAILREEGLPGFTQPKIAARTGLRQSHLTYYYPTRSALLVAVAEAAMELQTADAKTMAHNITSTKDAACVIAAGAVRLENTRVLIALCQASEQEPELRALFNELADNIVIELALVLDRVGVAATQAHADILHALFLGLSLIQLATGRVNGQARSKAALDAVFKLPLLQTGKKKAARHKK